MATGIPIDVAYREACAALGEQIVMERLMSAEIHELRKQNAELAPSGDASSFGSDGSDE